MTIVDAADQEWEGWPADQVAERGTVLWKTLISAGQTDTQVLTAGVALVAPGGMLRAHRHSQAEIYIILEGTGVVAIDGDSHDVGPGVTVFIPGDALHSVENRGATELRFAYVLNADRFEDVEYRFESTSGGAGA